MIHFSDAPSIPHFASVSVLLDFNLPPHSASEAVLWSQALLSEAEVSAAMDEDSQEASRSEDNSVSVERANRLFSQFLVDYEEYLNNLLL